VIVSLVFWAKMDIQDPPIDDLLDDTGDVQEDILNPPPPIVSGPANPAKITNDEIDLSLLHTDIKCSAIVPLNPKFKAMTRQEFRPFKLCLPVGFKPSALAFFKLFFTDWAFDILVQNTNLYTTQKGARTSKRGKGRRWKPVDKHKLSI
jgi:hypothetical protein